MKRAAAFFTSILIPILTSAYPPNPKFDPRPLMPAEEGDRVFTFTVMGDSKTVAGGCTQGIVSKMMALNPEFIITLGDMTHRGGEDPCCPCSVARDGERNWGGVETYLGPMMRTFATWPVQGNHEVMRDPDCPGTHGGDGSLYRGFYELPLVEPDQSYYSFEYENAVFIHIIQDETHPTSSQNLWLENLLQTTTKEFIFIILHQQFYTVGREPNLVYYPDLFRNNGVTAVLNAHDHLYYRTQRDGVYYIINGYGGAEHHDLDNEASAIPGDVYIGELTDGSHDKKYVRPGYPTNWDYQGSACMYTVFNVNGSSIDVTTLATDDAEIDAFTIFSTADTTPPTDPTNLVATAAGKTQVDLSWNPSDDPQTGVGGYEIWRGGIRVDQTVGVATNYSDTGLSPGTEYCYYVRAVNASGVPSGPSNIDCATTNAPDLTPPSVPGDPVVTPVSDMQIDLSWTASDDPETGISGYEIWRGGIKVDQTSGTGTVYSDGNLSENTQYCYSIVALNEDGIPSSPSGTVCGTTQPDTTAPQLLSAMLVDLTRVLADFSEPLEPISAETALNYVIDLPLNITLAERQIDPSQIMLTTDPHTGGKGYTLTVNDVTDDSSNKNPVAPDSSVPYTCDTLLQVTNVVIATGNDGNNFPIQGVVEVDGGIYTDRNYLFTVTGRFEGFDQIRVKNSDKAVVNPSYLTFDINIPATVYIGLAHDASPASWMGDWTATGETMSSDYRTYNLYKKDFSTGLVVLGGNDGGGSMYTVVLEPVAGAVDTALLLKTGLQGSYPNPARKGAWISVVEDGISSPETGIPNLGRVVQIYDGSGRLVRVLETTLGPRSSLFFDGLDGEGRPLPAGSYTYSMKIEGKKYRGRFTLTR